MAWSWFTRDTRKERYGALTLTQPTRLALEALDWGHPSTAARIPERSEPRCQTTISSNADCGISRVMVPYSSSLGLPDNQIHSLEK